MKNIRQGAKKLLAYVLTLAMVVTLVTATPAIESSAASRKYVKSISVSKTKVSVTAGKKYTVKATVKVSGKVSKAVKVKSSKTSVATVKVRKPSSKGVSTVTITGKKAGTAYVTVTTSAKGRNKKALSKKIKVTVKKKQVPTTEAPTTEEPVPSEVAVTSVKFNATSYSVEKGKSVQSAVTVLPANATNKAVTYSSDDESVAVVTAAGVIFGMGAGTTTVRATSANGKVSGSVTVTVKEPLVITLSDTELTIGKNQTANITSSVADVEWKSDNTSVATVDANGKVTGIAAGVANIIATSGAVSASCKVTVTQYDPENDGVTLSVFNPIKNNDGTVIENTCLVNQDMIIQAYVQKDSTPKKGARVKLDLEEIDSKIVDIYDFTIKVDGAVTDTAVTNENGIAEFTVQTTSSYDSTYDVQSYCPWISFTASATVDNQPSDKDITVKFASVLRNGIQVDNNRDASLEDIIPFVGHAAGDDGIETTWNTNDYYASEYVSSQQVGNDVYLSAAPYFILPPERKTTAAKFEVIFPDKKVTTGQEDVSITGPGQTETYTIYNDGADITTTTSVINVPEGLVSMSVFFNKISVSKYSQLYVTLYEYNGGIGKKVYEETFTDREHVYEKEDGVQIKNLNSMNGKGILIVSIQSPGQVDVSKTGYSLKKVTGDFNESAKIGELPLEIVNAVEWTNVTAEARYEVAKDLTYAEVSRLLAEYVGVENSYIVNGEDYSFAYRVPVFNSNSEKANAITGNALITATYKNPNGTVKTATYAYPAMSGREYSAEKDTYVPTNTNVLVNKTPNVKAIFLGYDVIDKDGNIQQITGGMTPNGNQLKVKSAAVSGAIFVEARLKIDALDKEIRSANKNFNYEKSPVKGADAKYPLYSYVQFVAKPESAVGDGTVPTFHALEDQYIVVTGEVKASNGEAQTSQVVDFYYGNTKITGPGTIGNNVQVKYVDAKTNKDGKAYLVLVGHEGSYVEDLSAKYDGEFAYFNTYAGDQKFEAIKQGDNKKNICNLCWLDLGLAYQKDATVPDSWIYSYPSASTTNTTSEAVVDTTWKVGFLPAVECPLGSFVADFEQLYALRRDPALIIRNVFAGITNVDVNYRFDGTNYENCKAETDAAVITSSKTGATKVYGQVKTTSDKYVVSYYDDNGDLQQFKTVGVNNFEVNGRTFAEDIDFGGQILYTMNWKPGNWACEFKYPYGNRVSKAQDTKVYFRLHDNNRNPIPNTDITITATLDEVNYTAFTYNAKTDADGLVIIDVPAPNADGQLIFTVKVAGGVIKHQSTPITYVTSTASALAYDGDPTFDKDATNKITLKFNNQIVDDVITEDMAKKLFVVYDKNGDKLEIDTVKINIQTVVITLKKDSFIEGENYTVHVNTGDEVKIDGIVYVLYDTNGQAMLPANADLPVVVKY